MRTILTEMTVCGFKSITKPITINFTNKKIDRDIFDKPLIKAIYGTNGEGKSAIIHSIDIYTRTVLDKDYVTVESANGTLSEIINKKLQKASINVKYATLIDFPNERKDKQSDINFFNHTIDYSVDNDGKVFVSHEKMLINATFFNKKRNDILVFEVNNGTIAYLNKSFFENDAQIVIDRSKNLLNRASLLTYLFDIFVESIKGEKTNDDEPTYKYMSFLAILFHNFTKIYLDEKDSHKMKLDKIDEIIKTRKELNDKNLPCNDVSFDYEVVDIEAKKLADYEKEIKKVASFLKIFKPELETIELDHSPIGNGKERCKKKMVYKNGNVISSEYESSGIKKLMKLYPILNNLEYDGIAFIDEFDSNIHDVYLCKIIEYVMNYTKGQLIFTTHNLGPMELLDKSSLKHTVDFINGSEITSWKKNGNYSIVKVYRGGAIPNCPFNIDAADFVKVFGE